MSSWVQQRLIEWLLAYLTQDKLDEWAGQLKATILPFLYKQKEELLARLLEEAKKTDTAIDDKLVAALDRFLDAFFPDNDVRLS